MVHIVTHTVFNYRAPISLCNTGLHITSVYNYCPLAHDFWRVFFYYAYMEKYLSFTGCLIWKLHWPRQCASTQLRHWLHFIELRKTQSSMGMTYLR